MTISVPHFYPKLKYEALLFSPLATSNPQADCKICLNLPDSCDCTVEYPVYRITCQLCSDIYIGESSRTVHDRLSEHLRFANNPIAPSYNEEAMAVHYRQKHLGES